MAASVAGPEILEVLSVDRNPGNPCAASDLTTLADLAATDTTTPTAANDSTPLALVGSA